MMNRAEEIETALTIGINELLHGDLAESIRLEFKSGWNPISIIHAINAKSYLLINYLRLSNSRLCLRQP